MLRGACQGSYHAVWTRRKANKVICLETIVKRLPPKQRSNPEYRSRYEFKQNLRCVKFLNRDIVNLEKILKSSNRAAPPFSEKPVLRKHLDRISEIRTIMEKDKMGNKN